MKTIGLVTLGILLSAGTMAPPLYARGVDLSINVGAPSLVYPENAPPAPIVEAPPASPGSGYAWIGGSWVWGSDNHWAWEKGRWDAPHAGMHYVPHRYYEQGNKHVFERGGWRK